MKKRFLSFFLALTLLCSLFATPAAAALSDSEKDSIRKNVSAMVKKQAAAVYQSGSADSALKTFFKYGFFGMGAKRTFGDSHSFVASFWNTALFQEATTEAITRGIAAMQNYGEDVMYITGSSSWHSFYYNYQFTGYLDEKANYARRYGELVNTKSLYGDNHFPGPRNKNDDLMELMVGAMWEKMTIRCVERKESSAVYTIDLICSDEFEFTGGYDAVAKKGFDTSDDEQIANLGWMLSFMGLDEFEWEYNKTLTVEVPYYCDHGTGNYRWYYDDSLTMVSKSGDGFEENKLDKKVYEYKSTAANAVNGMAYRNYYQLDRTVILHHDVPWVLEFDQVGMRGFQFSPLTTNSSFLPTIYANSSSYFWLYFVEYEKYPEGVTNENGSTIYSISNYLGVEMKNKFKYNSKHHYTFTLENKINADGSNMIYLTVFDHELGENVIGPEPMDDHWTKLAKDKDRTLVSTESDRANGMDIMINYLGNKNNGIGGTGSTLKEFEMRIYEGGMNPPEGTYQAPTCTEKGGIRHLCKDCGTYYFTKAEKALGHDYGEYAEDNNATCTEDGTKTRICKRCNTKDTVAVSGSALGHSYGDYVSDGNATCTADGTKTRTCTRCSVKDTTADAGSALGHKYGPFVSDDNATCLVDGTKTSTCEVCGDRQTETDVDTIKGHDFGTYVYDNNATCTKDGTKTAICVNCGGTDTLSAAGTATGHSHEAVVTAPTCTEAGFTTYTCHCGNSYVSDQVAATGHKVVIDPARESTCVERGVTEGSHCETCGLVLVSQKALALAGHTWDKGVVVNDGSNGSMGMMMYTCIHCGETKHSGYTPTPTPTPTPAPVVNPFTDVKKGDWFYEPVLWAVGNNVTTGKTATTFAPYDPCTRAQVVTFLWAAAGKPEPKSMDNPFTDVANNAWYLKPVLWAVENGITGGVSEGKFGPDATCNRAQIATFLWAAKGKHAVSDLNGFSDVKASDWFATAVIWAKENGITDGIGGGKFGPNDPCTRAQVVTFLKKAYE